MVSLHIKLKAPKGCSTPASPRQRHSTSPRQRCATSGVMFGKNPRLRLLLKRRSSPSRLSPSPDSKPRKDSATSPKTDTLERINALLTALADLKPSIDTIQYFIDLWDYGGRFCPDCTPENRSPGRCGRECSLLDPTNCAGVYGTVRSSPVYISTARQQKAQYHGIVRKMKKAGIGARSRQLTKWVHQMEELRKEMMNRSEKHESTVIQIKAAPGLDLEWTFERAWRNTPYMDEEVAPDELPAAVLVGAAKSALELLGM